MTQALRPKPILILGALLILLCGIHAPPAQAQPVVPIGSEMQVNIGTTGNQNQAKIIADDIGGFVVVWRTRPNDMASIAGRRLDSTGAPVGEEFQINELSSGSPISPQIVADGLGGFLVSWGQAGAPRSIQFRAFDSEDVPLTGDILANPSAEDNPRAPAIAHLPGGGFVVVWQDIDENAGDIRARTFDIGGTPMGPDFRVNSYTSGRQEEPQISSDGGEGLVVVWTSYESVGTDTDNTSIGMRRLDSSGQPVAQDFQVNSYTTDDQYLPQVGPDDQGGFLVTWTGEPLDGDTADYDLVARRFQSDGTPSGGDFTISDYATPESFLSLYGRTALTGEGGFFVVWEAEEGPVSDIWGRHFDSFDQPSAPQALVNASATADAEHPSIATLADGDFVVVWDSNTSDGTDSDGRSIQVRRFALDHDEDGIGTPVDTCTDLDGDGFGNPGFPANTCPEDNCPDVANSNQVDLDGDGIGAECDDCFGTNDTGDDDFDGICNDLDQCFGDDFSGDADGDGICADLDCDEDDATNACDIFRDGFESGDTSAWSIP